PSVRERGTGAAWGQVAGDRDVCRPAGREKRAGPDGASIRPAADGTRGIPRRARSLARPIDDERARAGIPARNAVGGPARVVWRDGEECRGARGTGGCPGSDEG